MSTFVFKYKERISRNYISNVPGYFKSRSGTRDILLIKLLTGTTSIEHVKDRKTVAISKNITNYPETIVNRPSAKQIREFISPFTLGDYIKYSQKFYGRNINFYTNLLSELTFYCYYSERKLHQTSFVHLYRLLEYISYSFPMIHSAHHGNLIGSYDALRSFFVGEKTSEIKFFELFIEKLFNGTPVLSITIDFDFSHADSSVSQNCFNSLRDQLKNNEWYNIDLPNYILTVETKHLIRLIKNLRNRYFHFAIGGQRNIGSADLKDPEFFFERVNNQFINWIGRIYKEIVKEILDNTVT